MSEPEISFESISKEDLLSYLKEKTKDLKATQRKLTKLEERYLVVFKEIKTLKKNIDNFYQIFSEVFPKMTVMIVTEESERINSFETNCELLASSYLKIYENSKITEKEMQNKIDEMREKTNKLYQGEIAKLQQQLFSKEDHLKEMERKINEHERVNFDSLLNELKNVSSKSVNNIEDKIQESDKTSEIIKLRSEIRDLRERVIGNDVRDKLNTGNGQIGENEKRQKEAKAGEKGVQTDDSLVGRNTSGDIDKREEVETKGKENRKDEDETRLVLELRIYVRDLLVKYFSCEKKKLVDEKVLILNVLFDVLKFAYEDRVEITKSVRDKRKFLIFN